jgi:Domain of unknown function (DUF3859)
MNYSTTVALLAALCLVGCSSTPKTRGAVVWKGTYTPTYAPIEKPNSSSPTGRREEHTVVTRVEPTNRVPASQGARFGIQYWLEMARPSADREIVWTFPPEGITNPKTKITTKEHREPDHRFCGPESRCIAGWVLSEPWELVPGQWVVELRVDGKTVIRETFELVEK